MCVIICTRRIIMATKTTAKPAAKAAAKPAAKPAPAVKEAKEVKEVHELAWTEGKGWAVKRQGSDKVIKYFKTKIEGTEYIVKVAGNQGTRVVIKLKNGKYQKFENAMRALSYAKDAKDPD
jgi:hypothetical protein